MDQWKVDKIKENIKALQKEEARQFAVVYGALPEQYHGYLQELPQNTKLFSEEADMETVKALQKEFGWDRVSAWKKATWYKVNYPYLGLAGHLAMLHDEFSDGDVSIEIVIHANETLGKSWAVATVRANRGTHSISSNGICEIAKKEDGTYEDTEIAASQAVRKAINLMGFGRFPIYTTAYSDNPDIKAYKEFLKTQRENKKSEEK